MLSIHVEQRRQPAHGALDDSTLVSPVVAHNVPKENVRALHAARMPAEFINGGQVTTDLRNGCLSWPRVGAVMLVSRVGDSVVDDVYNGPLY